MLLIVIYQLFLNLKVIIVFLKKNELDKVNELLGQENLSTSLSITDTVDQLNTQLNPTFDSLKSAYEDIFTTDDKGKSLFTLKNVDLSMLDSIKSAIDELNENKELGN